MIFFAFIVGQSFYIYSEAIYYFNNNDYGLFNPDISNATKNEKVSDEI